MLLLSKDKTRTIPLVASTSAPLEWVYVSPNSPYFVTESGQTWFPIGQNDAINWPDLAGLYGRRDLASVENYLRWLADSGATCLRVMLEYCDGANRYFEDPVGHFQPKMVQMWDDLFALCEKYGLRLLVTPLDTFWTWIRWDQHPYNTANGGVCDDRSRLMISPETRDAIKRRFQFVTERWGKSGALFAWDLWNEIHPAYAMSEPAHFAEFIDDVGSYLRALETRLYGRAHPQTVSVFGPLIAEGFIPQTFSVFTPVAVRDDRITECIYRHPALDFASAHFYEEGTIDFPQNTVEPALSAGKLVREAVSEIRDGRPFIETEHGPIHTFKDRHQTLPESFDDEYFRHIQWAEIASGAASGGMRWPNRRPHQLTAGMRRAQTALANFLPLVDWANLKRENWSNALQVSPAAFKGLASGDENQALIWLVRTDTIGADGTLRRDVEPLSATVRLPAMHAGIFRITAWDTVNGIVAGEFDLAHAAGAGFTFQTPPVITDMAFAILRTGALE